jgi:hypothetical protein
VLGVLVLVCVAGITVFIVDHYGTNATKATGVLGVVLPSVTAVIGAAVGYQAGNASGHGKGRAEQADTVKQALKPLVQDAAASYEAIASTVETAAEAPAGESRLRLSVPGAAEPQEIDPDEITRGRDSLSHLSGYLDGLLGTASSED